MKYIINILPEFLLLSKEELLTQLNLSEKDIEDALKNGDSKEVTLKVKVTIDENNLCK